MTAATATMSSRRWTLYALAFTITSMVAGTVYGWPALRRDIIKEGGPSEKQLGAVFTCGAWSVQGGRFMVGIARDTVGTRFTVCGCLAAVALGSILIAVAEPYDTAALAAGMLFLGMGSGAQLCVQPVTGLFKEAASTAMATLSGAFQYDETYDTSMMRIDRPPETNGTEPCTRLSGLVFLVLSAAASGIEGLGRKGAYLTHAAVVSVLFIASARYLPLGGKYTTDDEDVFKGSSVHNNGDEANGGRRGDGGGDGRDDCDHLDGERGVDSDCSGGDFSKKKDDETVSPVTGHDNVDKHGENIATVHIVLSEPSKSGEMPPSRREQMTSVEYIALLLWFSVIVTPSQYYVLSIGYQLEQKGDDDGAYTRLFTLLYGGSSVLAPLGGAVADTFGVGFGQCVATVLTAVSFVILLFPALDFTQTLGMAFYSVGRLFIFALYFSNIGRRFGFANYGTLAGTGMLTSAALSMLQYPLFTAAIDGWRDEVNAGCAAAVGACVPYTVWLSVRETREARKARRRKEQQEEEEETTMTAAAVA